MKLTQRITALAASLALAATAFAGIRNDKTVYVGGTRRDAPTSQEGTLDLTNPEAAFSS